MAIPRGGRVLGAKLVTNIEWLDEIMESGQVTFRIGRGYGNALVAEWPNAARLFQEVTGWRFEVAAHVTGARATKLALGPARAVERYIAGQMTLHASAVALDGVALAFIGPGGVGKSTIAARLCACSAASLLADDVLAVESDMVGLLALPTEATHWLRTASATVKEARPAQAIATHGAHVAAIVLLDVNEAPRAAQPTQLTGRAAMLALSQAHMTLAIASGAERRRDFEWLADVCARITIVRIPRTCGGSVDDVVSSALALLENHS